MSDADPPMNDLHHHLANASHIPEPTPADVERAYRAFQRMRSGRPESSLDQAVAKALPSPLLPVLREWLTLEHPSPASKHRLARLILEYAGPTTRDLIPEVDDGDELRAVGALIDGFGYRRVRAAGLGAAALHIWRGFPPGDSETAWRHAAATGIVASLGLRARPRLLGRAFALGLFHHLGAPRDEQDGAAVWRQLDLVDWLDPVIGSCGESATSPSEARALIQAACAVAARHGFPPALSQSGRPARSPIEVELERALGDLDPSALARQVDQVFHAAEFGVHSVLVSAA